MWKRRFILPESRSKSFDIEVESKRLHETYARQTFVQRNGVSRANGGAKSSPPFVKIYRRICSLTSKGERIQKRFQQALRNTSIRVLLRVESLRGNRRCVLDREIERERKKVDKVNHRSIVEIEFLEGD